MSTRGITYVDNAAALGRRLHAARTRAGLSQRALAFPGCTAAYISRIETGARVPSLQLLRELAQRVGVSEHHLARGDEAPGKDLGVPPPVAAGELSEGEIALRLDDDKDRARAFFEAALEGASDDGARAHALAWLGQLAFEEGDPRLARAHLEEATQLYGADECVHPELADTLGRAYVALGEDELAMGIFERCLRDADEREDVFASLRFSVLLGNTLIDRGNLARAEEVLGGTLTLTHGMADPLVRARVYWTQSRLHAGKNEPATAARYARRAIGLIELTEEGAYAAMAYQLLAHVELDRGRASDALDLIERGLELLGSGATSWVVAKFRLEEARAHAQLGDSERAAAIAMEAAGSLADRNPIEAGRGYQLVAEAFEKLSQDERAKELYELAVGLLEERPNRYLVSVYARLAELLEREGKPGEALALLKKAVGVQAEAGLPVGS